MRVRVRVRVMYSVRLSVKLTTGITVKFWLSFWERFMVTFRSRVRVYFFVLVLFIVFVLIVILLLVFPLLSVLLLVWCFCLHVSLVSGIPVFFLHVVVDGLGVTIYAFTCYRAIFPGIGLGLFERVGLCLLALGLDVG